MEVLVVVAHGLRSCPGLESTDSTVRLMCLATLQRVGSSQTTDPTCVSCIGKWILYHWVTREALKSRFLMDACIASHFSYCE